MQKTVVLMVNDPVITLDLTEMLQATLGDVRFVSPTSEAEIAALSRNAALLVLDRQSTRVSEGRTLMQGAPRLYVNVLPDDQNEGSRAVIEEPFTNGCVITALTSLGLVKTTQLQM